MVKEKRVPLNRLVLPETFELVKRGAVENKESEGSFVDRAVRGWWVIYEQESSSVVSGAGGSSGWAEGFARLERALDELLEHSRALPQTFQEAMDEYKARKGMVSVAPTPSATPPSVADLKAAGLVSQGMPEKPPVATITLRCDHCGKQFESESKRNITCEACAENGHVRDRYTCEQCRVENIP